MSKYGYIKITEESVFSYWAFQMVTDPNFEDWEIEIWEREATGVSFPSYIRYVSRGSSISDKKLALFIHGQNGMNLLEGSSAYSYGNFPFRYSMNAIHIHDPQKIEWLDVAAQARWISIGVYRIVNG